MQDTRSMFQTGADGSRVIALGIMQGDIRCADLPSVIDALRNPKSAFEQYQALVVADLLGPTVSAADQALLREQLQSPQTQELLADDADRRLLANRILSTFANTPTGAEAGSTGTQAGQTGQQPSTGGQQG